MNRRTIYGAIAATLAILTAGAAARIARAQSTSPLPDPSEVVLSPVGAGGTVSAGCMNCSTVVTSEPPTGFVGACLVNSITYAPALPVACYAPKAGAAYGAAGPGMTQFTFPASKVTFSYSTGAPNYDSYQALETCYPHAAGAACPAGSFAVSRSCCDYGAALVSVDGKTATGFAYFQ